jgi:hypothetical protein
MFKLIAVTVVTSGPLWKTVHLKSDKKLLLTLLWDKHGIDTTVIHLRMLLLVTLEKFMQLVLTDTSIRELELLQQCLKEMLGQTNGLRDSHTWKFLLVMKVMSLLLM